MVSGPLVTARLTLTPLAPADLPVFHGLVTDAHVRRFMMDGQVLPESWAAARIDASVARFAAGGVGLWLARRRDDGGAIGFCGFLELPDTGLGAELAYALRAEVAGAGLATEMAVAMIGAARAAGAAPIAASVDAVNAASVRILEKLGFRRTETRAGAFGDLYIFVLPPEGAHG
jgi:RimJ/RimL family protein N-acetyltransferase